jgi:putative glutamine transport system substrate-binding protein
MLKKILTVLILITFVCCGCGKKKNAEVESDLNKIVKKGVITVGVRTDAYPFGYQDKKGRYLGYDPAIARLIARGILGSENKVKFVPVTASDRMMKLYSGDVDIVIATMSVTSKRRQILDFSDPYYVAGQALLVKKGSRVRSLQDLNKKRAIIVFGSTSENSLRTAMPTLGIIGYKTYEEAYRALKQGKAEAIVSDDTILLGMALKDPTVELLPKRYTREPYAVAFRKGRESRDLIRAVNFVIETETRNGNLKKIRENYSIK